MRHDAIDPGCSAGIERPPDVLCELSPEALVDLLDAAERRSRATLAACDDELAARGAGSQRDGDGDAEADRLLAAAAIAEVRAREERQLVEIASARARVAAGTFAVCERCGARIAPTRWYAVPTARVCLDCRVLIEEEAAAAWTRRQRREEGSSRPSAETPSQRRVRRAS